MCALFGFMDCGKKIPLRTLQKVLQALANASEVRGDHACGIAYNKGRHMAIFKRPRPAHKLHLHVPFRTVAVMGHTRFTTQGSEKDNYNNHPFHGTADKMFALAHNGVLYNDRQLRMEKHLPETKIETDSYIAVQLIEAQHKLDFASLRSMAEDVQGNFTFTLLDTENNLWFVKGSNPLHLIYFPEIGLYLYASTAAIMTTALKQTPLRWMRYEVINVDDGELIKLSPDGKIEREHFKMQSDFSTSFFRHRYSYGTFCNDTCMSEEEQIMMEEYEDLLDICSYFGVTRKQVFQLLQMGYSYDEIEDYLFSYESPIDENDLCDLCCEI